MQLSFTSLEQELDQLRRENKDTENVCYLIDWFVTYGLIFSIKGSVTGCVLSNDVVVVPLLRWYSFGFSKCGNFSL